MNLSDLQYFQTIARCGNMTGAARLLGVRQPSLSIALCPGCMMLSTSPIAPMGIARALPYVSKMR